jgi:hypothetical protein
MDKFHRPFKFYQEYQCTHCLWSVNDTDAMSASDRIEAVKATSQSGREIGNSPKLYLNKYASTMEGCIGILGCKGRKTKGDCSYRRWNGEGPGGEDGRLIAGVLGHNDKRGASWCVQTRAGCHGCTEPRFPDGWGPFFMYK